MQVLITGGGGFIGSRLAECLLVHPRFAHATITLVDTKLKARPAGARLACMEGDLRDLALQTELSDLKPDVVFHLAGILGGAAEANPTLAREVNVDATLGLFERIGKPTGPPRVIFASSIAVFGPLPALTLVTDDTQPEPRMLYGTHKLLVEEALADFTRRGRLDGLALRLPGIVARRDADARMKSAYLHRLFYAYEAGGDITLPVSADGTSWLISVPACVDAFVHGALLPAHSISGRRAFTLPAQRVAMHSLISSLARRYPTSRTEVRFEPDVELERQFARQPALETAVADELGFKHDGSVDELVRRAIDSPPDQREVCATMSEPR